MAQPDSAGIPSRRRRSSDVPEASIPRLKRVCQAKPDVRCAACMLLFSEQSLQDLNSPDGFAHRTKDEFAAFIEEGCQLCAFIFDLIWKKHGRSWAGNDRVVFRNKRHGAAPVHGINTLQVSLGNAGETVIVCPFTKRDDPMQGLITRRPLIRDVQSKAVFDAARKLIRNCMRPDNPQEGHVQCRHSRDTVLPTRVLFVGDLDDSDSVLRLQVNDKETRGSYLALSYCWGQENHTSKPKPLRLRTDSFHDLRSAIRLESLPQSVQDAIIVTHKLGFTYLWVDALCIIQDDKRDKAREISKMATIYKNAALTLCAGTAENASEGFLQRSGRRSATYLPDDMFVIPMPDNKEGNVYLSGPYLPDHPLDKRGWTLQEFMLSSRMLIFSDYELLWQCREVDLRSVKGNTKGLEYEQALESLPWTSFNEESEANYGTLDFEKLYLWTTIIHQFTDRVMSNSYDRLNAVTGIITELEDVWQDINIYGHWKRWFIQLLAWFKPAVDRVEERHLKRAPSWSWASLDGGIRYAEQPLEKDDAKVKTLTVSAVVLTCRILKEAKIKRSKVCSIIERPDLQSSEAAVESPASDVEGAIDLTDSMSVAESHIRDPVAEEIGDKDCEYLLLGWTSNDDGWKKGWGLLVLPTEKGEYRRIGLAIFTDESIWEDVKFQDVTLEAKHDG